MKISAAYIRVSTADQIEYSPESQLRLIKDYAARNDIIISNEHIYRDEGISGRDAEKRPAFQKMISAAKSNTKPFECILVYSTSRFARNHEQSIVYRSMLARDYGIEVISITQPNVDKKTDMLTNAIYSVMDEIYSIDLADNVRRGMTQKAMKGGHQSTAPYGYDKKYKGAAITINLEEAEVIKFIFAQIAAGASKWKIARELNARGLKTKQGADFSTRTITYMLRNPIYMGYSRWTPTKKAYWDFKCPDTITVKADHEAIISEEEFRNVQEILDDIEAKHADKRVKPTETRKHWLSGILKCSACGTGLTYHEKTKTGNMFYRCGAYNKGHCTVGNYTPISTATDILLKYLESTIIDIDVLLNAKITRTNKNLNDIEILTAEKNKLIKKMDRAKQGFLNEVFDLNEYRQLKNDCEKTISEIEKQIEALTQNEIQYPQLQENIKNLYNVLKSDSFTKDEKSEAISKVIDKIVVNRKGGDFHIYFFA